MISFDEAVRLMTGVARPTARGLAPLAEAAGRMLAAPVIAMVDSPPADCSAMDGYAVREADLPGVLRIVGESFPGSGFEGALEPGTCVRIFTGAPVPRGADRVVIQEVAARDGDLVAIGDLPGAASTRPSASATATSCRPSGLATSVTSRSASSKEIIRRASCRNARPAWRSPGCRRSPSSGRSP